jgi:hypothetical protein
MKYNTNGKKMLKSSKTVTSNSKHCYFEASIFGENHAA